MAMMMKPRANDWYSTGPTLLRMAVLRNTWLVSSIGPLKRSMTRDSTPNSRKSRLSRVYSVTWVAIALVTFWRAGGSSAGCVD